MGQVQFVAIAMIRVSEKQARKIAWSKVLDHIQQLETGQELYPIDLHAIGDGTFTIAGNGRHRYFAYAHSGHTSIPAIVHH